MKYIFLFFVTITLKTNAFDWIIPDGNLNSATLSLFIFNGKYNPFIQSWQKIQKMKYSRISCFEIYP